MPIFEFTMPAHIYVVLPLMALGAFYIILFNQKNYMIKTIQNKAKNY